MKILAFGRRRRTIAFRKSGVLLLSDKGRNETRRQMHRRRKNCCFSGNSRFFLLSESSIENSRRSRSTHLHPTYFYQRIGSCCSSQIRANNNYSLEEQKQAFSTKNCVVLSRRKAEPGSMVEEEQCLREMRSSSFRQTQTCLRRKKVGG